MTAVRAHNAPVGVRGLLLSAAAASLIIAGLLGMHTLTTSHDAAMLTGTISSAAQAVSAAVGSDGPATTADATMSAAGMSPAGAPATADGHCVSGDCGTSMPDHTMLTMCVLALLSVAIVLLAPAVLARFRTGTPFPQPSPALLLRTLPPPHPPSLHVLSISRT
ncbi:MAG: DUF6153 family protein [Microbacteriaceae bacterium]